MRPGPRLLRVLFILCVIALMVPVLPEVVWLLLAGLVALLVACSVEAIFLGRLELGVEGRGVVVLSLGEEERVGWALRTNSSRPVHLTLRQVWPRLIASRSATGRGRCMPGEILRLEFPVRSVARGKEKVEPPCVAATLWGLVERILRLGWASELAVLPDLRAVGRLHAKLNRFVLRGIGSRTSARLGKGREFDRLREYLVGDDYRDVAWKSTARHGKLIVREYRLDRSQDVLVCLDRGHRMAALAVGLTKLDHAVNGAMVLAYICNRMEDRIGILSFASEVELGLNPGRGSTHLRKLTDFTARVAAGYVHTDYLALAADLRRRVRHRTLIVILTALPEMDQGPLLRAIRMLAPQHVPLVLVLSDPDLKNAAHFLPATKAELCRTLVAQDLVAGREQTLRDLRREGALVVETAPWDVGTEAMNAYIDVKRRQLL